MNNSIYKQTVAPTLSLFTSVGTLLCCALPALLVTLGMGASLAGLVSNMPWITIISDYKVYLFVGAGFMLALSAFLQWRGRNAPCPVDLIKANACLQVRKVSWFILGLSFLIYIVGFFFAFLAVDFLGM